MHFLSSCRSTSSTKGSTCLPSKLFAAAASSATDSPKVARKPSCSEAAGEPLSEKTCSKKSKKRAVRKEITESLRRSASEEKTALKNCLSSFNEKWEALMKRCETMKSSVLTIPGILTFHAVQIATASGCIAIYESTAFIIDKAHCPLWLTNILGCVAGLTAFFISEIGRKIQIAIMKATQLVMRAVGAC